MRRQTTILGYLGNHPELNNTRDDTPVTTVRVATQEHHEDETTWVNVTVFGQPAEFLCKYGEKGQVLYAEGRIQLDTWEDGNGNNQAELELRADLIEFPERSQSNNGPAPNDPEDPPDDDIPF